MRNCAKLIVRFCHTRDGKRREVSCWGGDRAGAREEAGEKRRSRIKRPGHVLVVSCRDPALVLTCRVHVCVVYSATVVDSLSCVAFISFSRRSFGDRRQGHQPAVMISLTPRKIGGQVYLPRTFTWVGLAVWDWVLDLLFFKTEGHMTQLY